MCLPLIGRVVTLETHVARVELIGGEIVQVSTALQPELGIGQYVLVDRGMIIESIEEAEAESMLAFYTELGNMWAEEDARWQR